MACSDDATPSTCEFVAEALGVAAVSVEDGQHVFGVEAPERGSVATEPSTDCPDEVELCGEGGERADTTEGGLEVSSDLGGGNALVSASGRVIAEGGTAVDVAAPASPSHVTVGEALEAALAINDGAFGPEPALERSAEADSERAAEAQTLPEVTASGPASKKATAANERTRSPATSGGQRVPTPLVATRRKTSPGNRQISPRPSAAAPAKEVKTKLNSADLEAAEIERKRREAKELAEKNARRMKKMGEHVAQKEEAKLPRASTSPKPKPARAETPVRTFPKAASSPRQMRPSAPALQQAPSKAASGLGRGPIVGAGVAAPKAEEVAKQPGVVSKVAKESGASTKALTSAQLEELEIERKRREAKELRERNARRMQRVAAAAGAAAPVGLDDVDAPAESACVNSRRSPSRCTASPPTSSKRSTVGSQAAGDKPHATAGQGLADSRRSPSRRAATSPTTRGRGAAKAPLSAPAVTDEPSNPNAPPADEVEACVRDVSDSLTRPQANSDCKSEATLVAPAMSEEPSDLTASLSMEIDACVRDACDSIGLQEANFECQPIAVN